jgi:hypothetical protein
MNAYAADRPNLLSTGRLLLVLLAAAMLLLAGGCGQFNDNPYRGMSVSYQFPDDGSSSGLSSPAYSWPGGLLGEAVISIVVGAFVITHDKTNTSLPISPTCPASGAYTQADAQNITTAQTTALIADAEASAAFWQLQSLASVPESGEVSFVIPPADAGCWQVAAVGLRRDVKSKSDIQVNDIIWYGFIGSFLNGTAAGDSVGPVIMVPWCNGSQPPSGNATCGT